MKNFLRALRCSLPYKGRLVISILCALLAAVFWSLNFTAIYPVLQVLGKDQSLQDWVDARLKKTQKTIAELQAQMDDLEAQDRRLEKKEPAPLNDTLHRKLANELA